MFGTKSFSDRSKREAIFYLRDIDDNIRRYLDCLPPRFHDELKLRNANLPLADPINLESTKKLNEFNVGLVQTLLDFFFDGDVVQRESFYKICIADAFNVRPGPKDGVAKRAGYTAAWALGMTNLGTDYYKSFKKSRQIVSIYLREGCHWAESAFIPKIVQAGRHIEDLEYELKPMFYSPGSKATSRSKSAMKNGFKRDIPLTRQPILDLKEVEYSNSERFSQLVGTSGDERFKHYAKLWRKDCVYEQEGNDYIEEQRQTGEFELARDFCLASLNGTDCWSGSIGKLDRFETIFKVLRTVGLNPEIAVQLPTGAMSDCGEQLMSNRSFFKVREFIQVSANKFFLTEMESDPLNGARLHWAKNYTGRVICKIPSDPSNGITEQIDFSADIAVRPLNLEIFYANELDKESQAVFNAVLVNDYQSFFEQAKNRPMVKKLDWFQSERTRLTETNKKLFEHYKNLSKKMSSYEVQQQIKKLPLTLSVESQVELPNSHNTLATQRLESFDKIGSYFDDFDQFTLSKLHTAGIDFDPETVDAAEKITPSAVSLALKLERILAPYIHGPEILRKFRRVFCPLDDKSSLCLNR